VTLYALLTLALFAVLLTALAVPLGNYCARCLSGQAGWHARVGRPLERFVLRSAGVEAGQEMTWQLYAASVLVFNLGGALVVYLLQRTQGVLPFNPAGLGNVGPALAFNTAISFATNTNWQAYSGETTLSHLTQALGLTVQNFVSAATGIAVLLAFVRGFTRARSETVGSFWVDLTRATLYVLLPLSIVVTIVLVGQGVVQTWTGSVTLDPLDGSATTLSLGPVASQVAIKQLGTNGGGFFNVNSAHPLENPTMLSNWVELLSILLVPAALCFSFGAWVQDRRQGWALFASMMIIFLPLAALTMHLEAAGNPLFSSLGIDQIASDSLSGGNMEGKEVRFGALHSALWAVATTAASNGSVNAMLDSFTPLGGLAPMWLMQLGEVVFGGVGSGLYGMLMYAVLAVFIAGLMVGRTPEYLGKKIESYEMKMACLVILLPSAAVLVGAAIACLVPEGVGSRLNPGAHGWSEILYAFSSGANNNGSAFAGLTASGPFYATAIGVCMWIGRFGVIVPVLAAAGALAKKKSVPHGAGTLPTHTPLFVGLLVSTVLLVGALTFIPALALGPIAEQLGDFTR
jgi:potassium-transporting ATPase potassium-binding subunit